MNFSKVLNASGNRTVILRNNILLSGVFKFLGLCCSILIVPVTLGYLNDEIYGIWLTMSSILYWFSFFDVGLGNGMRNYLTASISIGDYEQGRSYLSTTFFVLGFIAIVIALISFIVFSFLDMTQVFNTNTLDSCIIKNAMLTAIVFSLALFVVRNVGVVFIALQKYALNDFLIVLGNISALLIIYLMSKTTPPDLVNVVLAFTATPVIIFIAASIPVFKKYPQLKPSIKSINLSVTKKIIGKGLGFFLIQITSCLVIFGSANMFITQYLGPESVTVYNIAYKYFHLVTIVFIIILSPMWNAYTDAYVKNDFRWISSTYNKTLRIWGVSIVICLLMLVLCSFFYELWIGTSIHIPFSTSLCVMTYIIFFNLNSCVTYLLNGLNKIYVQIWTSIIATIIYLLIVQIFGKRYGIPGISLCMSFCYATMSIVHIYQCHLLINKKAKGIWNL